MNDNGNLTMAQGVDRASSGVEIAHFFDNWQRGRGALALVSPFQGWEARGFYPALCTGLFH